MAHRFSVTFVRFIALTLVSVFFILPRSVFAAAVSDIHLELGTAIMDRYNAIITTPITDNERAWIRWGIEHEGVPARVLRHQEKTWAYDSARQTASVYGGIYTFERGIADYAHGDRERAFETLGHLLHLIIDAHPLAMTSSTAPSPSTQQLWRKIIETQSTDDLHALTQEGVTLMQQFFYETEVATMHTTQKESRFFTLRLITAQAYGVAQRLLSTAGILIGQVRDGVRTTFARTAPIAGGGVASSVVSDVAMAEEVVSPIVETKQPNQQSPTPLRIQTPTALPIAQSVVGFIQTLPPVVEIIPQHEVPAVPPVEIPLFLPPPVIVPPPTPVVPPLPPLPQFDYLGFPIGYTPPSRDIIPPETTLEEMPSLLTNTTSAVFRFTAHESVTFFCARDGEEETVCTTPLTYNDLVEGQHTFSVRAEDSNRNRDATAATFTWTIDTIPPDTVVTQLPSSLTKNATSVFAFVASENGATFNYTLDGGVWQATTSPLTIPGLADGEHTVAIRALDAAGNADATPVNTTWTVDTLAPAPPTITSPTTSASYTTIASMVMLIGTREDGTIIAIDGSSDAIATPTGTTWEKTVTLALGTNLFSLTATDGVGNVSVPFVITLVRTENHAPTTINDLAVTTPIITNDRLTITWTAPSDIDLPVQTLSYILRYATTPITDETTWGVATNVVSPPSVGAAGSAETFTVTGLSPATTYYFALRTSDGELLSSFSNTLSATTHYGVRIVDAHFQGGVSEEYMTIKNERTANQPLEGWTLHDAVATPSHTYTLGDFLLAAGASVTIHTGTGTDTSTDLYHWNISIWNNDHDTAFLKDSGGTLIDTVQW